MKRAPTPADRPKVIPTMRAAIQLCTTAQRDIETILGGALDNPTHYAVLGRLDALAADVGRFVADALADAK
jgi:hypothetical protein